MKHLLLKTWLMLVCLLVGVGTTWGAETVSYTLSITKSNSNSAYSTYYDITVNNIGWKAPGNQALGNYIKIGGKLSSATNLYMYSKNAISDNITKVVINHGSKDSQITVNSVTLKVYSTAADAASDANAIESLTGTYTDNGNTTITKTSGANWSGKFYRIVYNLSSSASSKNYGIIFNSATFYKGEDVADTRTAVNMTGFSAISTTLVKGGTTNTSATNDQSEWTASYTYESSNTNVATVSNDGVITAVAKGTATITATLNIANDDVNWKKGATASKTIDITVNNPSHTAHFSVNGTIDESNNKTVEEGEAITFPATNPSVDGVTFMGWSTAAIDGTQNDAPTTYKSATMGDADVTYYAVFATLESAGETTTTTYTLNGNWTTDNGNWTKTEGNNLSSSLASGKYGLNSGSSTATSPESYTGISKVVITGSKSSSGNGSWSVQYGSGSTWTDLLSSNNSKSVANSVTWTPTSLVDGSLKVVMSRTAGNVYIASIAVTTTTPPTYSDYCTTVSSKATPTLSFENASYEATMGEDFTAPTLTNTEGVAVTYTSSETSVATVDSESGVVSLVGAGTTTITATFAGNESYNRASASYQLEVAAAPVSTVFASLEELVGADLTSSTNVTVSFENVPIKAFQTVSSTRRGVYFDIQKDGNDIEIYFTSAVPAEWTEGGTLSGTLTNCPWKLYSSTWELAPASGWSWSNLIYNAPANYAPTITTQPVSATYEFNATATNLTVAASGNPAPIYQWYSNTTNSNENGTELTGETNTSYKPSTAIAGTFYYYCVATNSEGSVASDVATITVNEPAVASLPFEFDGGKNDIASKQGMSQSGLGTDYNSSPKLKFDSQDDNVIINFNEAAKKVTYTIKGNGTSGTCAFDVMESADGVDYTTVHSHTSITDGEYTDNLASTSRFVKFVYTTKASGNVALGKISIIAASVLDDPELAFGQSTYTFFTDDEMQVVATSAAGSTGAITYALTAGDEAAFLIDENTGDIVCETAGTYTVTATIASAAGFAGGTATCTVKIKEPIVGNSIIVAQTDDGYYAMTTTCEVSYFGYQAIKKVGSKYVVSSLDNILFCTNTADGKTTIQNASDAQYVQATAAKNISYTESEYKWTNDGEKLTAADNAHGTLQYNTGSPRFTTYTSKVGQYATIVDLANVIVSTGDATITIAAACTDGETCYSTYSNANAFVVPEGLTVSTVGVDGEGKLVVNSYNTGDIVAANTGVMVSGAAGDHIITLTNAATTDAPGANNLHPSSETMTGDNLFYRLTMHNGTQIGFWWGAAEGAPFSLAANKAYLAVPNNVSLTQGMWFGDNLITGLNTITVDSNATRYDLQGRVVGKATKGIQIMNGRKVIR